MNGNITHVESLEDRRVIHTTYGLEKALSKLLEQAAENVARDNLETLFDSYLNGPASFADTASVLFEWELNAINHGDLNGMSFTLTKNDNGPVISFEKSVSSEDMVQAIKWLIDELQKEDSIEMLGEKITYFTAMFFDVPVLVSIDDTVYDIQKRWCTFIGHSSR